VGNGVAGLLIIFLCIGGVLYLPFESTAKFPSTDWLGDWVSHNSLDAMEKESSFRSENQTMFPQLSGL
jgi:hypothetical protein